MKSLFYIHDALCTEHLGIMLDEAKEAMDRGEEVLWVYCDSGMCMICGTNFLGKAATCKWCMKYEAWGRKTMLEGVTALAMSQFCSEDILKKVRQIRFDYQSLSDIKKLDYKDIPIGFAALSTYITFSRCNNPKIDQAFRDYFDVLLQTGIKVTLAYSALLDTFQPDRVYVFNGRMIQSRPVLEVTLQRKIALYCMEVYSPEKFGSFRKIIFKNFFPHSIINNQELMDDVWANTLVSAERREQIARSFFEKRRHNISAGDKVYTNHQVPGTLPQCWDRSKENIVIFNSSEDEFSGIGGEWEEKLFPTQLEGIQRIVEHYELPDR